MNDSTTTRPRPRPKPKPKPKVRDVPETSATPGEASGSSSTIPGVASNPATRTVIEINDSDDMFIRNKNRTFEEWQRLEQINREANKSQKEVSSDSDDTGRSPSKQKNKKKKREAVHIPLWQKHKEMARLLSEELSEESDIEILGDSPPNGKPNGKRKRKQRSRSRSITPPPALPQDQIMNAKAVVRRALQLPVRAPSPTFDNDVDESTDTIIFDPELNAIANELRREQSVLSHTHSTPAPEATNDEDNVLLTVKFKLHPLSPEAHEYDTDWQYKIDRTDAFRDLFEAVAEDASIQPENLILTYLGKRFFPSVTPQILKIWSESAELVAYEKTTYEYIHKNPVPRYTPSQAPAASTSKSVHSGGPSTEAIEIDFDSDDDNFDILGAGGLGYNATTASPSPPPHAQSQSQIQQPESDAEAEGETLKLTLRSALIQKDITLTVRPTTKCGAIVKAFLKKAGLADQYPGAGSDEPPAPVPPPKKGGRKSKATLAAEAAALAAASAPLAKDPRLCIDGDKMENGSPIGEQDVEDGDMIEVVGL